MLLISRVVAGALQAPGTSDEAVDVWAQPGTEGEVRFDRTLDRAVKPGVSDGEWR